jgi:hypothetical protein
MANATPEVKFEATLKPAARGIMKHFDDRPGIAEPWLMVKDAQLLRTRLQKRAASWCPACLFLVVGIVIGVLPVPAIAKYVTVALASAVFGWLLSSYLLQARKSDRLYDELGPAIKMMKAKESNAKERE